MTGASGSDVRSALVPMAVGYAVLMAFLGYGLLRLQRRGSPPPPVTRGTGWRELCRQVAVTMAGGFVLLMVVVTAYYYGVDRLGGNFLESALTGFALMAGLAVPVFAALSCLAEWHRRRRRSER